MTARSRRLAALRALIAHPRTSAHERAAAQEALNRLTATDSTGAYSSRWDAPELDALVGRSIRRVFMNEEFLLFDTDAGPLAFTVEGDCCSSSYFYDFVGVGKLLANGRVVSVASIDMADPDDEDSRRGYVVVAYGFEVVTEHPMWGEQTSVLSFRNDSNGYYGGWMLGCSPDSIRDELPELGRVVYAIDAAGVPR